jgi:hypothetical protein
MAKKRDYISEIHEIKDRLFKRKSLKDQFNRRLHPVVSGFHFLCSLKTDAPLKAELMKYIPVGYVACIEGYCRLLIKELIDSGPPFQERATSFDEIKFNIETVIAIRSRKVSLGEYIAHLIPLNNLADINRAFSILIGEDFLTQLKKVDTLTTKSGPRKLAYPLLNDKAMSGLQELFRLRHIFAHELALREKVSARRIQNCVSGGASFVITLEEYINNQLPK